MHASGTATVVCNDTYKKEVTFTTKTGSETMSYEKFGLNITEAEQPKNSEHVKKTLTTKVPTVGNTMSTDTHVQMRENTMPTNTSIQMRENTMPTNTSIQMRENTKPAKEKSNDCKIKVQREANSKPKKVCKLKDIKKKKASMLARASASASVCTSSTSVKCASGMRRVEMALHGVRRQMTMQHAGVMAKLRRLEMSNNIETVETKAVDMDVSLDSMISFTKTWDIPSGKGAKSVPQLPASIGSLQQLTGRDTDGSWDILAFTGGKPGAASMSVDIQQLAATSVSKVCNKCFYIFVLWLQSSTIMNTCIYHILIKLACNEILFM